MPPKPTLNEESDTFNLRNFLVLWPDQSWEYTVTNFVQTGAVCLVLAAERLFDPPSTKHFGEYEKIENL